MPQGGPGRINEKPARVVLLISWCFGGGFLPTVFGVRPVRTSSLAWRCTIIGSRSIALSLATSSLALIASLSCVWTVVRSACGCLGRRISGFGATGPSLISWFTLASVGLAPARLVRGTRCFIGVVATGFRRGPVVGALGRRPCSWLSVVPYLALVCVGRAWSGLNILHRGF